MDQEDTTRTQELHREIQVLDEKDIHLWSVGVVIILVLACGFAALILPHIIWHFDVLRLGGNYLPQLFLGFVVLIILFNVYTLKRRRTLLRTRGELVRELVRREAAEKLSLVDPVTELYNRRYLDQVLPREVNRADRLGTPLTFLKLDIENFKAVNTQFGHMRGDRVLADVAELLKRNFRSSDTIVRHGSDEFLVLMTDTDETQAQRGIERLNHQIERWNQANSAEGFTLAVSCGLATYVKGNDVTEVLHLADQKMYQNKRGGSPPAS
jgi:diguanylate cyclase (GGDEF)-like protein